MKNKIFKFLLFFLLLIILILFFNLILSIIIEIINTKPIRKINYNEIFFAIKITIFTATISSVFAIIFAIPIAYILAKYNFPLKNFIDSFLYLPIIISPIALGAMLLLFFSLPIGKFIEKNFFNVVFEVPGIIFAQFVVIIGIAINLLKTVFEYIDPEYENIAKTLGASDFYIFLKIILPLSKNGIITSFLLIWARAIGEFGASVILAGATTMKTETIPVAIFLNFASGELHTASILILIALFISISILFIVKTLYAKNKEAIRQNG